MEKFIYEIPVKIKRASGESFPNGMGSRPHLESSIPLEIEATDAEEASAKLHAALASLIK